MNRPSSEIQSLAIKPVKQGRNVIGQIQSCPGNVCAFSIGILQIINTDEQLAQAIILTPTSELVDLTYTIGTKMHGLTIAKFDEETPRKNTKPELNNTRMLLLVPLVKL